MHGCSTSRKKKKTPKQWMDRSTYWIFLKGGEKEKGDNHRCVRLLLLAVQDNTSSAAGGGSNNIHPGNKDPCGVLPANCNAAGKQRSVSYRLHMVSVCRHECEARVRAHTL